MAATRPSVLSRSGKQRFSSLAVRETLVPLQSARLTLRRLSSRGSEGPLSAVFRSAPQLPELRFLLQIVHPNICTDPQRRWPRCSARTSASRTCPTTLHLAQSARRACLCCVPTVSVKLSPKIKLIPDLAGDLISSRLRALCLIVPNTRDTTVSCRRRHHQHPGARRGRDSETRAGFRTRTSRHSDGTTPRSNWGR